MIQTPRTRTHAAWIAVAFLAAVCAREPPPTPATPRPAEDPEVVAARGEKTLLGASYGEPFWRKSSYENVWRVWGRSARPSDFEEQVRARYGLHRAPYENDGLPMGLHVTREPKKGERGITFDCNLCHSASMGTRSYLGLPNATLDMHQLNLDLDKAEGQKASKDPFPLTIVRGLNQADAMAVYLTSMRHPDLSWDVVGTLTDTTEYLGWNELPHLDTPPWWLWRVKDWLYCAGEIDARSHTSATFLLFSQFRAMRGKDLLSQYEAWRDVRTFIRAKVEPPPYPFPVDEASARRGAAVYAGSVGRCSACHGTYDDARPPRLVEYSNPITALGDVGTDPVRYRELSDQFIERYNRSVWFGREYKARKKSERTAGYVAQPLIGVWATAPYLHNGSVPTMADLLERPDLRPSRYYRAPTNAFEGYDQERLGWKVVDCARAPCDPARLPHPRMIYDTSWRGLGKGGHRYGTDLSPQDKRDLIEFLKLL